MVLFSSKQGTGEAYWELRPSILIKISGVIKKKKRKKKQADLHFRGLGMAGKVLQVPITLELPTDDGRGGERLDGKTKVVFWRTEEQT